MAHIVIRRKIFPLSASSYQSVVAVHAIRGPRPELRPDWVHGEALWQAKLNKMKSADSDQSSHTDCAVECALLKNPSVSVIFICDES